MLPRKLKYFICVLINSLQSTSISCIPGALEDDRAAVLLLAHLDAVAAEDLEVVLVPLDRRLRGAQRAHAELDLKEMQ